MDNSCGVQKQFSCDSCCYRGKTKAHLRSHKNIHIEKTFLCSQCNFKTQYKHDLARHRTSHSNQKPFKCDFCGKCFRRSRELNYHIRTHTGEKPYKCFFKDCEYSSTCSGNLQRHFNRHTGEKPYRCSYGACEYAFKDASKLKRHTMSHKNGKVYTCSFKKCKYSSIHASDVKTHTNGRHSRSKRHVCQSCECRYETAAQLKRHRKSLHSRRQTCISRRRPNSSSSSSSSVKEIESTKTVSNSMLIKSLEVDEDPKLSVPTFVLLTRLKPDSYIYNKNSPATNALKLKDFRDPIQKIDSRPGDSPSAGDDPKLRVPTIVVLKRLHVDFNSDDEHIGESLRAKTDLTIPTLSKCTEINTEPQTGLMPKPWKASLYTCKICDYETKKFKKYKTHLQSHREQRQFLCPLCDFVGLQRKHLKAHFRIHDNDTSGSDKDCYSDTQSHHARMSITGQEAPFPFDNTSVNPNCFRSQSSKNEEIEVQQNAMVRISHSVANIVQLQEIRTKQKQSLTNPNIPNSGSQAKKQISPQSSKKKHVMFSCIFCNKIFKKEMKLLNHLRYHTGEPRPSHLHY